jgi:arabinogalactan oligomer / maltooligosaccharide transport system permease protein
VNRLSGFTGTIALLFKIIFMGVVDALLLAMFLAALHKHSGMLELVVALVGILANIVYFSKRTMPFKFLYPGLVLLILFVVIPVGYTVEMSVFNFQTGNVVSKTDAMKQLLNNGLAPDVANTTYDMVLGSDGGKFTALLTNPTTHISYIANEKSVVVLTPGEFKINAQGDAVGVAGFTPYTPDQEANLDSVITSAKFPMPDGNFIQPQTGTSAALLTQTVHFDGATGLLTDTASGKIYKDNGNGNFANVKNPVDKLYPGWKTFNKFQNYAHLLTDPTVRGPFIGVFIWTFAFAVGSVLLMFGFGLLLAIALDQDLRFKRFYRSIVILPYAIPSFMSILIWKGMFNTQFGAVNGLLHTHIDFFNSPWLARMMVLLVNLWLGLPYFYLISTGALQAIPADLEEAAEMDGATASQILRRIKLPLLLQILAPLLISSFAFNFNNFSLIYLLTGGGPTDVLNNQTAGATDILITYTYKTAFNGASQNYGLASAISMLIFLVVASLSLWSLRRSRVLDLVG